MDRVYLDWNATAPVWPEAVEAVAKAMQTCWGNASSLHEEGRKAAQIANAAREALAGWSQSRALEWILTSGGTESIHAAIHGAVLARKGKRRIVTSQGDHSCTLGVVGELEKQGFEVVRVKLRPDGAWDPDEILAAADPACTTLVSLIWANNETGVISPVQELSRELKARRIPFHLDAVQCFGRIPVDLSTVPVAMVSLSAHKFGGPKGVGALFVRQGTAWTRWLQGGNQERSRRGGTVNVPGAAGMAAAIEQTKNVDIDKIRRTRDWLETAILEGIPYAWIVGGEADRLPNTCCLCVPGCDSSTLLDRLDERGYAVASGSACTTGVADPSHVLLAIGMAPEDAHSTIRISLGPATDADALTEFVGA
ncbi:MAG: cysteine desulfurase family protein, partial [Fibrobacterota bacterium]